MARVMEHRMNDSPVVILAMYGIWYSMESDEMSGSSLKKYAFSNCNAAE